MAAVTSANEVTVFDVGTLEALQTRVLDRGAGSGARCLIMAPGGDHLYMTTSISSGWDEGHGRLICLEADSLKQVASMDPAGWISCTALSPDGTQLAAGCEGSRSGRFVCLVKAPVLKHNYDDTDTVVSEHDVTSMQYTPPGGKIAVLCSEARLMQLLCVETCTVLRKLSLHPGPSTLKFFGTTVGHRDTLVHVCYGLSPKEGRIRLLEVDSLAVIQDFKLPGDDSSTVTCCAFAHEHLAIGCAEAKVHLLDLVSLTVKVSASLIDTAHMGLEGLGQAAVSEHSVVQLEFVPSRQLIVAACTLGVHGAIYLMSANDLALVRCIRSPGRFGPYSGPFAIDPLQSILCSSDLS